MTTRKWWVAMIGRLALTAAGCLALLAVASAAGASVTSFYGSSY